MSTIINAVELIEANVGDTITVLRARLVIEGYKASVINEAIAKCKAEGTLENKSRSAGFASDFYAFLAEESRDADEVTKFIDAGSDNVKRHRSHYEAIWDLTETVRENMADVTSYGDNEGED